MIGEDGARHVKSVAKAFDIVSALQSHGSLSQTELAERVDLAKSTVHNYLGTLESMGYVTKVDGEYRLGLRFLTHGMASRNSLQHQETVVHTLSTAGADIQDTVWWIVEEFGRGIFAAKSTPEGTQEIYGRIGKRSYLHTHAPGKVILSQAGDEYVERIAEYHGLPAYTSQTITDIDKLRVELENIREQGYARTKGETAHGITSIGVGFNDPNGRTHSVGIFRYSQDLNASALEDELRPQLESIADYLTRSISQERT